MKKDCRDCCYPEVINAKACGCCEGIEPLTPLPTANRPGLSQLSYRIGGHASFLQTMIARLSSSDYPQLAGLTTRDVDDSSIALLDSWAMVADVLTFYQERIANEGYLRTATERRSVLELARLVGYQLRPGVSSSVFLAYTIAENTKEETTIPAGSRAQSVPGPGELPQSFETSEDLKARVRWNNLKPRMTQLQTQGSIFEIPNSPRVYLKGINTNLNPNDPLLIGIGENRPTFYRVKEVEPDAINDRTRISLLPTIVTAGSRAGSTSNTNTENENEYEYEYEYEDEDEDEYEEPAVQLLKELTRPASLQPVNSLQLKKSLGEQFKEKGETGFRAVSSFSPVLRDTLAIAAANAKVTLDSDIKVYALRVRSSLFGHNLPLPSCPDGIDAPNLLCCFPFFPRAQKSKTVASFPDSGNFNFVNSEGVEFNVTEGVKSKQMLALDAEYKELKKDTWVAVDNGTAIEVLRINEISSATLGGLIKGKLGFFSTCPPVTLAGNIASGGFGVSIGDTTKIKASILTLDAQWRGSNSKNDILRKSIFYGQSEEIELAEEPIETTVCGGTDCGGTDESGLLELDGFYDGLESGRWVVVSGERDITGTSGVRFSELAMLSSVAQDVSKDKQSQALAGEKIHTFITLAEKLQYCFKRDTVTIYGNVVKATHGETRKEVLGSGDGSKVLQSFELKQSPLTHVSATNPSGVDSTLEVSVNNIQWHETDSLTGLQSADRMFVTRTDNDSKTSIIFGNGKEGARLPTGIENIRAEYRTGTGKGGNVKMEQISLLATKPLGVKEVINPLRASGGADRENRDQARKSAPLAVMALDRLVSVRDYKDFARLYAGIGKSDAVEITDGRRQLVHVTIAGADDIPIDENSDLFINLQQALHDFGDPYQLIQLAMRELQFIVISANVQIKSDYQWEPVAIKLRAALLDTFGFERRELGQDVVLSEVTAVLQAVSGVTYVDVDTFGGIPEKQVDQAEPGKRRLLTPDEITKYVQALIETSQQTNRPAQRLIVNLADAKGHVIQPAQLAFLTPDVPDTLILNQIK